MNLANLLMGTLLNYIYTLQAYLLSLRRGSPGEVRLHSAFLWQLTDVFQGSWRRSPMPIPYPSSLSTSSLTCSSRLKIPLFLIKSNNIYLLLPYIICRLLRCRRDGRTLCSKECIDSFAFSEVHLEGRLQYLSRNTMVRVNGFTGVKHAINFPKIYAKAIIKI